MNIALLVSSNGSIFEIFLDRNNSFLGSSITFSKGLLFEYFFHVSPSASPFCPNKIIIVSHVNIANDKNLINVKVTSN